MTMKRTKNGRGRVSCMACEHLDVATMDRELVLGIESNSAIANRYGLHRHTTKSHFDHCLTERERERIRGEMALEAIVQKEAIQNRAVTAIRVDISQAVGEVVTRLNSILDRADAADDHRVSIAALRELRQNIEMLSKIAGGLSTPAGTVSVDEVRAVRAAVLRSLQPYPDAQERFDNELKRLNFVPSPE